MNVHDRFRAWVQSTGKSQQAIGELLGGYTQAHVCHLARSGDRRPSRRLALAIERLTATWEHGPIRASEWDAPLASAPLAMSSMRPTLDVAHPMPLAMPAGIAR